MEEQIIYDDEDVEMEEQQQTLPILEKIPDEIWLKIFGELDKKNLLNATLVCKQWNDIISNSSTTLKNLTCRIIIASNKSMVDMIDSGRFKITRKYNKLSIISHGWRHIAGGFIAIATTETFTKLLETITISLSSHHLISLYLRLHNSYDVLRLVDLVELLSCCHVLEDLTLSNFDLDENGSENLKLVKLNKLKYLNLESLTKNSVKILDFIECATLKKFVLDLSLSLSDHVIEFLNRLDRLDELFFRQLGWESKILLKPKFRWSKLYLSSTNFPGPSSIYYDSAIASMEALGRASKEKAEICFGGLDSESDTLMMQPILNSCANIKELTFDDDTNYFPSDISQMRQLNEIEKLTIDNNDYNDEIERRRFVAIMEKMPNIKHFKLIGDISNIVDIELAPILFQNVALLELPGVSFHNLEQIQSYSFPSLTTLAVEETDHGTGKNLLNIFEQFSSVNLNLTHLEIKVRFEDRLETTVQTKLLMRKLYFRLCHTSWKNFKLTDVRGRGITLEETRDVIEMKEFGKVLSEDERNSFKKFC